MILNDNSPMPYGRYKGDAMINVPAEYLMYLYDNNKYSPDVLEYIKDNMDVVRQRGR